MNELIESIFSNFAVGGVNIPVVYMYYFGHGEPYITYGLENTDHSFSADDELQNYVEYYDFDIYSKSTFYQIIESVKNILKQHGFIWQPTRSSMDMYEVDTGYHHRTLSFAYIRKENNNG